MPFRAVLFDMDGTLVDNMSFHTLVWVAFLREHGAQVDGETFHDQTAGMTTPEILRKFLGDDLPAARIELLTLEKEDRYRQGYAAQFRAVAGASEFVRAAKAAGLRTGLATAAPPVNIDFVLSRLGLVGAFDAVTNGEDITRGKPDPEIYLKTAAALGVQPQDCLVFEDAPGGIQAAQRAGMRVAVITTGLTAHQALALPGVVAAYADFCDLNPAAL